MIYLAQTDTTAGFLSQNLAEINRAKGRAEDTPCLITTSKFSVLRNFARVPVKFKNLVRRAKKTTFLYPNKNALRVVKGVAHEKFLDEISWAYSSSANIHGGKFDLKFAMAKADKVVDSEFFELAPSRILKLSKTKIKKKR